MVDAPRRRAGSTVTRERLLAAARKLFLDVGYDDTTVRNIAKEASVTIGAFYGHFDSKRAALFEVVRTLNVTGSRRRTPFGTASERALLLTVASFAHADRAAALLLGEVIRSTGQPAGALEAERVRNMVIELARRPVDERSG